MKTSYEFLEALCVVKGALCGEKELVLFKVFQVGRSALWLRIDVPRIKTSYES